MSDDLSSAPWQSSAGKLAEHRLTMLLPLACGKQAAVSVIGNLTPECRRELRAAAQRFTCKHCSQGRDCKEGLK